MARNGSGVYSLPAGSVIANGDTSDAADLNVPLADLEADMNTPRPVVAGGTGADNAADARTNLGLGASSFVTFGAFSRGAPVTKTADFTVAATENWLVSNKSGSACVVTLPAAASFTGREIMFQNLQAQEVNSASSNVVPIVGGSAVAAILPAVAGATATLVSDGTNWKILNFVLPGIGENQTWQNVAASRAAATTYTNTSGRPIQLSVNLGIVSSASTASSDLLIDGVSVSLISHGESNGTSFGAVRQSHTQIIPNGSTYRINVTNAIIAAWWELR